MPAPTVAFNGPWDAVTKRLVHSRRWLQEPAFQAMRKLAHTLHKEFKKRLRSNPPPALAASTIRRKRKRKSRSPTTRWRDTYWLSQNAVTTPQIVQTSTGGLELRMFISDVQHPTAKMPASKLFNMLEFGTKTAPARPILRPFISDLESGKVQALEDFKKDFLDKLLDFHSKF